MVSTIQKLTFVTFEQRFSYNHAWSCWVVAYRKQKTKECIKIISGPKSGCGRFGNLGTVVLAYERVFETDWETKGLFVKRLLTGGGRLWEVVAMRELTVLPLKAFTQASRSFKGETALVSFCQDKFKQHIYIIFPFQSFPSPLPVKSGWKYRKMVMLYPNFLTLSSIRFPISMAIGGSAKNSQIHQQKPLIKLFFFWITGNVHFFIA